MSDTVRVDCTGSALGRCGLCKQWFDTAFYDCMSAAADADDYDVVSECLECWGQWWNAVGRPVASLRWRDQLLMSKEQGNEQREQG